MRGESIQSGIRSLRLAMVLMTTLPVGYPVAATEIEQRRSMYCYPLVGLFIGILLWATAGFLGSGSLLSAAIVILIWVLVTGAIHLDGLADCADAWMAGLGDRDKTLHILKDPLCGAISVVTLIVVLLVKVAALQQILTSESLTVLVVIPVLARVSPQIMFWNLPYIRHGGLGESLKTSAEDRLLFWVSVSVSVVFTLAVFGAAAIWLLLVVAIVMLCVFKATERRLGGFTGDVLGAQIEILECALCVAAALLI